jgi:hypothetical protein
MPGPISDQSRETASYGGAKLFGCASHDDAYNRAEIFAAFRSCQTDRSIAACYAVPQIAGLGPFETVFLKVDDAEFVGLGASFDQLRTHVETPGCGSSIEP